MDNFVFKRFLKEKEKNIENYIRRKDFIDAEEYYHPKNVMWLEHSLNTFACDFLYLKGDSLFYDLVAVKYLGVYFAIPVPVLAKILKVDQIEIFNLFKYKKANRSDVRYL